jgi:hypothetical protein
MWILWVVLVLCVLAFAAAGLGAYGARRWENALQVLRASLQAGRAIVRQDGQRPTTHYDARELEGLPAPVQRYFRKVLRDGQPLISAVTIEMTGTFNLSAIGEQWKPFTSRQWVVTRRPGFIWDARIAMLPGLKVRVVDSYVAGKGLLRAAVGGLFTMAEVRGEGDIARGEFMRWFAEVAWYPTALLPSQGVRWEAVDDHSANATFADGPLVLTLLFTFNDAGLLGSFRADARGSMVDGKLVMAPWEGSWSNYQERDGVHVPFTGEVAWIRPEGRRCYFVGTVTSLSFTYLSKPDFEMDRAGQIVGL